MTIHQLRVTKAKQYTPFKNTINSMTFCFVASNYQTLKLKHQFVKKKTIATNITSNFATSKLTTTTTTETRNHIVIISFSTRTYNVM